MKSPISATGTTSIRDIGGRKIVRKEAQGARQIERLTYQHDWLAARQDLAHTPTIRAFAADGKKATLDLDYLANSVPFVEYIAGADHAASALVLNEVIDHLRNRVHLDPKPRVATRELASYIQVKVLEKVAECERESHVVAELLDAPVLEVNGVRYENFPVVMARIQKSRTLMKELAQCEWAPLHGDPTVDNIVVERGGRDFLILDPNGENIVSDPLVDFAKLYQSLHSGYEALCGLKRVTVGQGVIEFPRQHPPGYTELFATLRARLARELGERRLAKIKFHEAVHYARMLPYKARTNPLALPAFFATMVKLLNEFYGEF